MFNKMIKEIVKYKVGIMVGAIVGAGTAYYLIAQGQDLSSITAAGKGLVDSMMTRSAPLEIAKTKMYVVFTTLGAIIGYLTDRIIN